MGAAMGGAALGTIGSILGVFGKQQARSDYPMYQPVDLAAETSKTISTNLANLPAATKLATGASMAQQDIVLAQLRKAIPQYDKVQSDQLNVVESLLHGEVPKDVQEQMQRSNAAAGFTSGTAGSEFSGAKGLRNLGLTSLQLSTTGLSAADRWLARAEQLTKAPTMDVWRMFISPTFGAQFAAGQAEKVQESKLGKWSLGNFLLDASTSLEETGGMWSGMLGGSGGSNAARNNFNWIKGGSGNSEYPPSPPGTSRFMGVDTPDSWFDNPTWG